jgi:RHS repeat-associated protein
MVHGVDVPVGQNLPFNTKSDNMSGWKMFITPPPGYDVLIDGQPDAYRAIEIPDPYSGNHNFTIAIVPAAFAGMAAGSTSTPEIGRFIWDIGLGYAVNGQPSGRLTIRESVLGEIWQRENLRIAPGPNVPLETYYDGTGLRRVRTDILVDVEDIGNGYKIDFYPHEHFHPSWALDEEDEVEELIFDDPWRRIEVQKVGSDVELRIYNINCGSPVLMLKHTVKFEIDVYGNEKWTLDSGGGSVVKRTVTHDFNDTQTEADIEIKEGSTLARKSRKTYTTVAGNKDIVAHIGDYEGQDYTTTHTYDSYYYDWLKSVRYPDGGWEYYTHDYFGRINKIYRPFLNTPASPGVDPGGEVTEFTFDQSPPPISGDPDDIYEILTSPQGWNNEFEYRHLPTRIETTIDGVTVSKTEFAYDKSTELNGKRVLQSTRDDYSAAAACLTNVSRSYSRFLPESDQLFAGLPLAVHNPDDTKTVWLHQPGAFAGTSTLDDFTPSSSPGSHWRTIMFNGRHATSGTISSFGSGAGNAIESIYMEKDKSTIEVTVRGYQGRVIRREVYFFNGSTPASASDPANYVLIDWGTMIYDRDVGYQLQTAESIRTPSGAKDVQNFYGNDGRLAWTRDALGQRTQFTYDALGRVAQKTLLDVEEEEPLRSTLRWYNAAGDVTAEALIPESLGTIPADPDSLGSPYLLSKTEYDLGGRVTKQIGADGVEVGYAYLLDDEEAFYRKVRRYQDAPDPDDPGATVEVEAIEQYHLDGRLEQVTGDAGVPVFYGYEVDENGLVTVQESYLTDYEPEPERWRQTTTDWLGRSVETKAPRWSSGTLVETFTYYGATGNGNAGKLQKHTAPGRDPIRYEYDALGQLSRQGLDINDNGLVLESFDRIADHDSKFINSGGSYFLERSVYGYPNDEDEETKILLSRTRERLTGFASESVPGFGTSQWKRAETLVYDIDSNVSAPASLAVTRKEFLNRAERKVWQTALARGESNASGSLSVDGLLTETRTPAGVITRYTHDALARREQVINRENGNYKVIDKVEYATNSPRVYRQYRTRSSATPNQLVAEYDYYVNGAVRSVKNAQNNYTYHLYNERGQPTHRWGVSTTPVKFGYNAYGERVEMRTYQEGAWNSSALPDDFDETQQGSPDPSITAWVYDEPTGLLVEKQDPLYGSDSSRKEVYSYTTAHQLHQFTRARGVTITHAYAAATGELTGKTYSDTTPAVSFTYNRLGALKTVTDVTGTRTFNYNATDQRINYISLPSFYGSSRRLTVDYDTDRRVKGGLRFGTSAYPNLYYEVGWTWADGRVTSIDAYQRNSASKRTFGYGFATQSNLVNHCYTTDLASETYWISRTWGAYQNKVSQIRNRLGTDTFALMSYSHDAMGRISYRVSSGALYTGFGNYNYLETTYAYTANGRLSAAETGTEYEVGEDEDFAYFDSRTFDYGYDSAGNRASAGITTVPHTTDYTTTDLTNAYAEIDNRTHDTFSGSTDSAPLITDYQRGQTIPSGELPKPGLGDVFEHVFDTTTNVNTAYPYSRSFWFSNPALGSQIWRYPPLAQTITHDKDGNLTDDGDLQYVYDAENRLIQIVRGDHRVMMKYDYMNRRVEVALEEFEEDTWTAFWTRRFLYDGWHLIAEMDPYSAQMSTFFWGYDVSNSIGGAGGIGGLLLIDDGTNRYLPSYDVQGNVILLVKESDGSLAAKFEYGPYGEVIRMEGAYDKTPFRWQTKWDLDYADGGGYAWGVLDYGLRWYQPKHGRFINRDPIGEAGGLNLYEAFGGDPVNNWDYLGMWFIIKIGEPELPPDGDGKGYYEFPDYSPTIIDLLEDAEVPDGIPTDTYTGGYWGDQYDILSILQMFDRGRILASRRGGPYGYMKKLEGEPDWSRTPNSADRLNGNWTPNTSDADDYARRRAAYDHQRRMEFNERTGRSTTPFFQLPARQAATFYRETSKAHPARVATVVAATYGTAALTRALLGVAVRMVSNISFPAGAPGTTQVPFGYVTPKNAPGFLTGAFTFEQASTATGMMAQRIVIPDSLLIAVGSATVDLASISAGTGGLLFGSGFAWGTIESARGVHPTGGLSDALSPMNPLQLWVLGYTIGHAGDNPSP